MMGHPGVGDHSDLFSSALGHCTLEQEGRVGRQSTPPSVLESPVSSPIMSIFEKEHFVLGLGGL